MVDAQTAVRDFVLSMPRVRITEDEPGYIRAEFSSRFFKFVDDVEFLLDAQTGRIDYRSASRVGYYDFGVNRRRLETIRGRLAQHPEFSMEVR
jgi:uncharacterized protein (DUF1499 family)